MHKWKNENIGLTLDITTYCNARCPQCSRTNQIDGGLKPHNNLPMVHWLLPEIQTVYTAEQLKNIRSITFSPSWGDPMMNPDAHGIVDHLLDCLPIKANLTIITNGSMRNEEFWWKLGGLAYKHPLKNLSCVFDIDGIDQEMHSYYRRGTQLEKVLNHMKAFSDNGKSITLSQSIIFKHNQDYMQEIKELAESYGSQRNTFVKSDRFALDENKNYLPYKFLDENNEEQILEWADKPWENTNLSLWDPEKKLNEEVVCKWAVANNLNINFDGQVWPCCYIGAMVYSQQAADFNKLDIAQEYNLMRLESNIKFTPLKDIINNKWFTETIQNSIKNDPIRMCKKQCSTQLRSYDQQQLRLT